MSLRIALCIGVADYHEKALKLTNPINDADCIHKALQSRGFDSTLLLDPTADVLMQALTDLSGKIAENGGNRAFGVVFFAGHAIEIGGFGILMPTDMAFPASPQAIRRSGIPVLEIIKALSAVHGPKVVIIDACRDADPVAKWDQYQVPAFNAWMDEEMGRMRDATDVNEVTIAYSTSAGQKAYEGAGLNSLYCEKLQASLLHHGSTIVEALTQAGSHVTAETLAKQRPWVYTNMGMKCGFGDLPTYALAYTTTLTGELHSGSRLHVRMEDDSLAVNLTGKLQFLQDGTATGGIIHSPKVSVACFWKDEVLLAGANCFVSVDSTMKDKRRPLSGFEEIATEFEKPHGIAIGPDGMSAIVYGSGGYSVLRRADAKWKLHYSGNQPSDIYGAIFQSTDVAYLCGSGNYILRLNLGGEKPQLSKIEIESYLHIYDMTWLSDQRSIVAVCSQGVVIWINVDSLESNVRQMFIWPSIDVPGAYGRLRRMDLSPEEASLFLEDRKTFDVKVGRKAWSRLSRKACPDYDLLCCTLTSDPRVLAIGSDAGLVFLIDVRSGEPFATLDAGSGIGARLQWMACPANGSINVLAGDGIVRCFEPVLPQA